jgi:hypothetical protein
VRPADLTFFDKNGDVAIRSFIMLIRVSLLVILSLTALAQAAEPKLTNKAFEWGDITCQEQASPGDHIKIRVRLTKVERAKGGQLRIDPHWYQGKERAGVIGMVGRQKIEAKKQDYIFEWTIPADKEGLSAVSFVTYGGEDDSWSGKRFTGTLGMSVR